MGILVTYFTLSSKIERKMRMFCGGKVTDEPYWGDSPHIIED
jgi:hypothetical protein